LIRPSVRPLGRAASGTADCPSHDPDPRQEPTAAEMLRFQKYLRKSRRVIAAAKAVKAPTAKENQPAELAAAACAKEKVNRPIPAEIAASAPGMALVASERAASAPGMALAASERGRDLVRAVIDGNAAAVRIALNSDAASAASAATPLGESAEVKALLAELSEMKTRDGALLHLLGMSSLNFDKCMLDVGEYCRLQVHAFLREKNMATGWRMYDFLKLAGGVHGDGKIDHCIEAWFPGPILRARAIAVAKEAIEACKPHRPALGVIPTADKPMFCSKCAVPMQQAYVAIF
jgi:hypothetical protein